MERREVIGEKRGGEGGARVALRERGGGERKKTRPAAAPWAPRVVERRRRRRRRPPPSPPTTRWRGGRGGESRLQVFRSLMCDLPQTRQSVPPFPSGSAGIKESALGPPPLPLPSSPSPSYKTLPVFRIIPPQPANFLSRERGGFRLSRKEGKRAEGRKRGRKAAAVRLCRLHRRASPKTWANYFSDLFFPRV